MDQPDFTQRQQEVVELLKQGKGNKQIALALGIAERTVEDHLNHIYSALGVSSRTEAIIQLGKAAAEAGVNIHAVESTVAKDGQSGYAEEKQSVKKQIIHNASRLSIALVLIIALIVFLISQSSKNSWSLEREAEFPDEHTVGQILDRSKASGDQVFGQFGTNSAWSTQPGSVTYRYISVPKTDHLFLQLRYSKYGTASVSIMVFVDDEKDPRANIFPQDQGDWNRFTWTEPIDLGEVESGVHAITFYTAGQNYGVADLDKFTLTTGPP